RVAFSYVKNQEDALDIIQESIHKALKSIHTLNNRKALRSWFMRIVINTSLDFLRKKRREVIVDDQALEYYSPIFRDKYTDFDLTALLENLAPKYRIIIILRFFEDLSIRDIAEILNENENTVKSRLYKGLKILKINMDNHFFLGGSSYES